jgi:hypothetical protein
MRLLFDTMNIHSNRADLFNPITFPYTFILSLIEMIKQENEIFFFFTTCLLKRNQKVNGKIIFQLKMWDVLVSCLLLISQSEEKVIPPSYKIYRN